jgi:hypothetical protein
MIGWKILQLTRKIEDGFVTAAQWSATVNDNGFSASAYGSVGFSGDLVTPYENLGEEQVLRWVWANGVDKDATEESLAAQIEAQKNPITTTGVPW